MAKVFQFGLSDKKTKGKKSCTSQEIGQINSNPFSHLPLSQNIFYKVLILLCISLPILLKLGKAQQLKDEWRTETQRVTKWMMYSKLML